MANAGLSDSHPIIRTTHGLAFSNWCIWYVSSAVPCITQCTRTVLSVEGHDKQNSSRVLPVRPAAARTHRRWTSILQSCRSPWRCWSHVWSAGCPWGAVVRLCARRRHVTLPAAPLSTRYRPWSRADTGLLPLSCCSDPTVAWLLQHQLLPQAQQVQCSWSSRCCCAKARMVQELSIPLTSNTDRPTVI